MFLIFSPKIEFDKAKTSIISPNLFMEVPNMHKYNIISQKSSYVDEVRLDSPSPHPGRVCQLLGGPFITPPISSVKLLLTPATPGHFFGVTFLGSLF